MPRAPKECAADDCDELVVAKTHCAACATRSRNAASAQRSSRRDRGYDRVHDAQRAAWAPHVERGDVECRRGPACLYGDRRILVGQDWDLGHPDATCSAPRAPEHRRCNRAAAGRSS